MLFSFSASGTPKEAKAQLAHQLKQAAEHEHADEPTIAALEHFAELAKAEMKGAAKDALVIVSGSLHLSVSVQNPKEEADAAPVS